MSAEFGFDVDQFLAAEYDQATSTKMLLLPDGYEGVAQIEDVKLDKLPSGSVKMVVKLAFTGGDIPNLIKRDKFVGQADFFLDMTEQNGRVVLDMSEGMNVGIGQLRAALGQNTPGESWSPKKAIGNAVRVKHTIAVDKNDAEKKYSRFKFLPRA